MTFSSTRYIVLYPQNGDRIVTIGSVTSFHAMYWIICATNISSTKQYQTYTNYIFLVLELQFTQTRRWIKLQSTEGGRLIRIVAYKQCRINHVADVANATGLRPQGGLRKWRKFFQPVSSQVNWHNFCNEKMGRIDIGYEIIASMSCRLEPHKIAI